MPTQSKQTKIQTSQTHALTDNGILTHTDTVNKVGNDAIESAKVTDSRKFQTKWPWVSYDKSTGKMYCEACIKTGKKTHLQLGAQPTKRHT